MKNKIYITLILFLILTGCKIKQGNKERLCSHTDINTILSLFPKDVEQVKLLNSQAQQVINNMIKDIDSIPVSNKNFSNTIKTYEVAKLKYLINRNLLNIYANLASDQTIQNNANTQALSLDDYEADSLLRNPKIYNAFQQYCDDGSDFYCKKGANRQFLQKTLQKFERNGLLLSDLQQKELISLDKKIKYLEAKFNGAVVYDNKNITASLEQLQGIDQSLISTLSKDSDNNYILPIDFDTFFTIMENCESEILRKKYYIAFGQIGYFRNQFTLPELLDARNQFAQMLGYTNFATYELYDQMIKNPQRAEKFLWNIVHKLQKYDDQDFLSLKEFLPKSVTLLENDILKPWDEAFVKSSYRKNNFIINDYEISKYFPLNHTLNELLKIFEKFFFIEFKKENISTEKLWAPDVICYRVYSLRSQAIIGYLFLDLNKHDYKKIQEPCHFELLPSIKDDCSIACAGASVMVANFKQATIKNETLLELSDVISLFHELGHALHSLFGSTCFVDFSGTQVIKDFLEVPSQMLEYWIEEPTVLRLISKHYQTNEKLPEEMIEQIIGAEHFCKASRMLKQAFLGLVSLKLHTITKDKNIHETIEKIYKKVFKHITYEHQHYLEYRFTHLVNYGSSYYSYVWSRVIAADLFNHIKENGGILNSDIGKEYEKNILMPGGFISPEYMLKNFLKRPFELKSFLSHFEKK